MLYYSHLDLDAALFLLWRKMKRWFKARKVTCSVKCFSKKVLGWDGQNTYPSLASFIKGAHVKLIIIWLANENINVVNDGIDVNPHAQLRATCNFAFVKFITILDGGGLFVMDPDRDNAVKWGKAYLLCYQALAATAYEAELCLYKIRPKMHYFAHLLIELGLSGENPRRYDLFGAESFMGKIRKLGSQCHRANMPLRILHRYLLFLGHRWRNTKLSNPGQEAVLLP